MEDSKPVEEKKFGDTYLRNYQTHDEELYMEPVKGASVAQKVSDGVTATDSAAKPLLEDMTSHRNEVLTGAYSQSVYVENNKYVGDLVPVKEKRSAHKGRRTRKTREEKLSQTDKRGAARRARQKASQNFETMTQYSSPRKGFQYSLYSAQSKYDEPKVSKVCKSEAPFRRVQTKIMKSIKSSYREDEDWEDAMDKNLELVGQMVRERKNRKEMNVRMRYQMTDMLDEIEKMDQSRELMLKQLNKLDEENTDLKEENKFLETTLKAVYAKINGDERELEEKALNDEKIAQSYKVEKLQRDLEENREEWRSYLEYQKTDGIESLQQQLTIAQNELNSLEQEGHHATLKLNQQRKKLLEKSRAIDFMIDNMDHANLSNGNIPLKGTSMNENVTQFHKRLRKIVNGRD